MIVWLSLAHIVCPRAVWRCVIDIPGYPNQRYPLSLPTTHLTICCSYPWSFLHLWCEPRDHMVTQPTRKDTNSQKVSKSGLIGVWYKDNLYLGTRTIGNGDPDPTNIDSRTRSTRMTPRRQLFFDKSFFSFLENHGREIISPTHTHTHTQSAANKKFY